MTTPNGPDGNDEVIRVVYQAVADYSSLFRETRRAREQTAALKRDIDGLAGTTTAKIRVEADTSRARTELGNLIRDAVIRARVVLDAAAARSQLAGLVRDLVIKARMVADTAAAKAEIRAATRDAEVRVAVRTDSAGLARLAADLAKIRDLIVRVSVRADTAALAALRTQLAALRDLTVRVSAQVDTASLAALRAQLGRLRDLTVRVGVDVDTGELAALRAQLGQFRDLTVNLAVDLDEAGVTARYAALLAHLESLGPIRLHVDLDRSIFTRIAELEAAIDALRTAGSGAGAGGADAAGEGLSGLVGSLNPAGLAKMVSMVALVAAAVALAIPIVAGLTAAIGAAAAAALAAGGGLAIFAVGAIGAISEVTEAVKAFTESGTIAAGPVGDVVRRVQELKGAYQDFQAATRGPVLAVFDRGLQIAIDLLDRVEPLVASVAGAVEGAMQRVQQALAGPGFDGFLDFVARQAPHAIDGLTEGLLGFTGGIGSLIQAFEPLIDMFVDGFAKAGRSFADWAANLDTNQGFQDFLAYATAQLPKVIDLIGTLITAGGNIVQGLAPAGSALLDIANAGADVLAAIPPEFWEGFASAVVDSAPAVLALAHVLIDLVGVLDTLDVGFGGVLDAVSAFLTLLAQALRVLSVVNPAFAVLARIVGKAADATAADPDTGPDPGTAAAATPAGAAGKALAGAAGSAGAAGAAPATGQTSVTQGLQADFGADAGVKRYNDAVAAMQAYEAQQQAVVDAERAVADAQYNATRAQEALSDARLAAVQRIKDVQRALRDQPVDERQAALSDKQAKQRLAELIANGGTEDDIEQARIDAERAANTLTDLQQDKGPKRAALQKELAAGVDGNKQLRDAVRQNQQAQTALKTANTNMGAAAAKLTELHLAFQTAAGALGLTEGQLKTLKKNVDAVKNKTVKVTLNTKDAEAALAGLLKRQYALQLMAKPPYPSFEEAMAQAAKALPATPGKAGAAAGAAAGNAAADLGKVLRGAAAGGPLAPSAVTAGPVYGPGTGTSDSIAVRLPVGGPAALSRGEHIVTDAEVQRAPGGHNYVEAFRAGLRAGRPWGPAGAGYAGYRAGGPATLPALRAPVFALAALPSALPGYAAGGAARAYRAGDTHIDRSVTVHVGSITNAVPEPAGTSLYRQVRKAADGDEG